MASARDVETELKRRVAYLPGGRDRSGLAIVVVPIDPPPGGLCGHAANSPASAKGNRDAGVESADGDARMTRGEEARCQDLDRVLRYLLPIAT